MIVKIFIAAILITGFLVGIRLMQSPRTALWGNRLGAFCMALAILLALREVELLKSLAIWFYLLCGGALGIILGQRVKMIQMPQTVALLNGFGGAASALVAGATVTIYGYGELWVFWLTAALALAVGILTWSGSMVAALKLQGWISQKPVIMKAHGFFLALLLLLGVLLIICSVLFPATLFHTCIPFVVIIFILYGLLMTVRVGGADMPIIISFLNSLSGIAAAICGLAVGNLLLASVGALVGVAGMILTQIMCRAINRNLLLVLGGLKSSSVGVKKFEKTAPDSRRNSEVNMNDLLKQARKVILVPGYGMAVAQAQRAVKELLDALEKNNREVKIAIHPVAGRMPGHMNVLLAEVGIPYEKLFEMDAVNPEFSITDLVIAIGACDVINPAANTAEGTPIYGMPILKVELARHIIVCNLNAQPGYSGVENTLYQEEHVLTLWGNAAETVPQITAMLANSS